MVQDIRPLHRPAKITHGGERSRVYKRPRPQAFALRRP